MLKNMNVEQKLHGNNLRSTTYQYDHLGNNRVVVNESGTVEQVNHYYPYGGLMGESIMAEN